MARLGEPGCSNLPSAFMRTSWLGADEVMSTCGEDWTGLLGTRLMLLTKCRFQSGSRIRFRRRCGTVMG